MALLSNLTLQKRIGLLVLAGLTVSLTLFSWLSIQSVNQSVKTTLEARLTTARMMARHLDETLTYVLSQLQSAASHRDALFSKDRFDAEASSIRGAFTRAQIFTQIFLIDGHGKVLYAYPEAPRITALDVSDQPEVQKVLTTKQSRVSDQVSSPLSVQPAVLVSAPVFNGAGELAGVLLSTLDVQLTSNDTLIETQIGKTGYAEIVDGNGIVIAKSKSSSPQDILESSDNPLHFGELIAQNKATVGTCHRCHDSEGILERKRDILAFAPLSSVRWGVAIRQSEEEALAPTRQLQSRLFLLGIVILVATALLTWSLLQGVVRPIRVLISATQKIAHGDFRAVNLIKRQDEIGELNAAFYNMTQDLAKARDELVSRNESLAALNSLAQTLSQSLNREEVLKNALEKTLALTKATTGCVFLSEPGENRLKLTAAAGRPGVFACGDSESPSVECACHSVLRSGQTLMVNHSAQCSVFNSKLKEEGVKCFISIPLKSKNRTLGIMNVGSAGGCAFTENDFHFFDSIGHQVGLAIENAVLYEEAKQKEVLRGQLFNYAISAREEERKRIARELHDDYGQTLTGLIMSIESLEDGTSKQPFKEKVENAKAIARHALEDLRRLTGDLRPSALDDLGLLAAIRAYIQRYLEAAGIQVKFDSQAFDEDDRLSPVVETTLFRIIQEASHNIVKYAEARNVKIQLKRQNDRVIVTIKDDGKGFDVESAIKSRNGDQPLGILGMKERTTLLGGKFSIKSKMGQGTSITVEIPVVLPESLTLPHHMTNVE